MPYEEQPPPAGLEPWLACVWSRSGSGSVRVLPDGCVDLLARVLRLQRLLTLPPEEGLAEVALEAGYADQAHMSAEVRKLTGLTPAALRTEHVRFAKDVLAGAA